MKTLFTKALISFVLLICVVALLKNFHDIFNGYNEDTLHRRCMCSVPNDILKSNVDFDLSDQKPPEIEV